MSDNSQLIDELLATIALIEVTPDVFEGKSHDYVGSRIFGGQVLAQAIMAAAHTLDQDKPCSLRPLPAGFRQILMISRSLHLLHGTVQEYPRQSCFSD